MPPTRALLALSLFVCISCGPTLSEQPPNQPETGPSTSATSPGDGPPATSPAAPPPWTPPTKAQVDAQPEWFQCTADADCKLIDLGCCDYCNGGAVLAVRADHVDDAHNAWKEPDCLEEIEPGSFHSKTCNALGCLADPEAVCQESVCTIIDRSGAVQPNPMGS